MVRKSKIDAHLLVEGKNDLHVISAHVSCLVSCVGRLTSFDFCVYPQDALSYPAGTTHLRLL
jgi:hypothetical protein